MLMISTGIGNIMNGVVDFLLVMTALAVFCVS